MKTASSAAAPSSTRDPEIAAQAMRDHIETIIGYWSAELLAAVQADPNSQ